MFSYRNLLKRTRIREFYLSRRTKYEATSILVPELDESVYDDFEKGLMTSKKHPGRIRTKEVIALDEDMMATLNRIFGDSQIKTLLKDAKNYVEYISARQPPASKEEQYDKSAVTYWEVYNKSKVDFASLSRDQYEEEELKLKKKADLLLKSRTFAWKPIEYTEYVGKQYLMERMLPEYAALNKIFLEISQRCPTFQPHSLFDLASGVGTVTLAARKYWENSIKEYYNVDPSGDMHDIARRMLTKGFPDQPLPIKNVYYRQFSPSTIDRKYSLTVCSYSLREFPSSETRLQSLWKLWNRTEDFMVLVDQGSAIGFKLILEARDFILNTEADAQDSTGVCVFSPCPHELDCPLLRTFDRSCRFKTTYERVPISRTRKLLNESFSYVVLRRGKRPEDDPQWPRVMRTPFKKKKRTVCHMCTNDGKLRTYQFKKSKHGTLNNQISRALKAGDRLPFKFRHCDLSEFKECDDAGYAEEITNFEDVEGFDNDEEDFNEKS